MSRTNNGAPRCKSLTAAGGPCRAQPGQDGYCFAHSPSQGRKRAEARLAGQAITDDRIERILAFADGQRDKIAAAARSFAVRHALLDELQVTATLERGSGMVTIRAACLLGEDELFVADKRTGASVYPNSQSPGRQPTQPPQCARRPSDQDAT